MRELLRFSLKNAAAVLLLVILVIAGGVYATEKIKIETYPDVAFPALFIQTTAANHSAEEIEEQVTKPLEDGIKALGGYDTLTSTSANNTASIEIEYPYGTDMDKQEQKLQTVIANADLPDEAKAEVKDFSTSDQAVYETAIVQQHADQHMQTAIEDELVPKLKKVEGVASVDVQGEKTPEVSITVDKNKAEKYGLTLAAIEQAIQSQDYKVSLGEADKNGAAVPLELKGDIKSVDALKNIEITSGSGTAAQQNSGQTGGSSQGSSQLQSAELAQLQTGQTKKIKLSDVAAIKQTNEQSDISRFNGKDSYLVSVTKKQDANTDQVVKQVKKQIDQFKQDHPATIYTVKDQGKDIEDSVSSLLREAGLGILFAVIVILLFLRNLRATVIAIISLPTSILATIWVLKDLNYTLNIMTLGGMAVAVGRIVDDSIVVIENIFRWRQEKQPSLTARQTALYATKEVSRAVASSTLATLVVFLPLAFVSGVVGELFRPFAIAVVLSIFFSLLVALFLVPVLGSTLFKKVRHVEKEGWLVKGYERLLRGALRKKGWVIAVSILLLMGSAAIIPTLDVAFLPTGQGNTLAANISLPKTVNLDQTDHVAKKVESYLRTRNDIDYSQVSIGVSNGVRNQRNINDIALNIQLKGGKNADYLLNDFQRRIQKVVNKQYEHAGVNVSASSMQGGVASDNIEIQLSGGDADKQAKAADDVVNLLKKDHQLKNIGSNKSDEQTKWRLTINSEGKDAGVQYTQVMQSAKEYLSSVSGGPYDINGTDQDVVLSYNDKMTSQKDIEAIKIKTPQGIKTIGDVADMKEVKEPTTLYHDDGDDVTQVTADIKGNDTAGVTKRVIKDVGTLSLPKGVNVQQISGGLADIQSGFSSLGLAMGAAVLLVFFVLSITFSGFLTPLVILSSLIFVPIGALGGLFVSGEPLSMSAMIGMLMLIGIVVTNAVVLLDRVETNRKKEMPLTESIVEAAKRRVRPILMTAFATIFALIPLALTPETSSLLISKGLAVTVIGGLLTSTLLTLIFVPVLYSIVGKKRKNIQSDI